MKNLTILIFLIIIPFGLYSQSFTTKNVISSTLTGVKKHVVADLDLDGDLDIVVISNPEGSGAENNSEPNVLWYENDGGLSFTEHIVDYEFVGARGLGVGDLTGNGYPDIVVGSKRSSSTLVWYENDGTPASGSWTRTGIGAAAPNNFQVHVLDVDGDGELDIVDGMGDDADNGSVGSGTTTDQLRWFQNDGNASSFTLIEIAQYSSPSGIAWGDFDGDSDLDFAASAWVDYGTLTPQTDEDVRWWSQSSGPTFSQQQVIQQTYGANDLYAFDIDDNNTLDLVSAGYKTSTIDWWSNNGSGVFSSINSIATSFSHTRNVMVSDIDGDGDWDIVAAADDDGDISWFENNGFENFSENNINSSFTYAYFASVSDLDGDGDVDVIGTAQDAAELSWWENDLAEEVIIGSGPAQQSYYSGDVVINFAIGFSGGNTTVFFNHGNVPNKSLTGTGVDHVAQKGFYTITTAAATYDADIDFSYSGISEWSAINDENDLIVCYFDPSSGSNGEWLKAGSSQTLDTGGNIITVHGLTSELAKYSVYTLGSSTTDNALPVELVQFEANIVNNGIELKWDTASEIDNAGFELWRKTQNDTNFYLISDFKSNEDLLGLGTSSFGQQYKFFDSDAKIGNRYIYKLVDVTYNGSRFEHNQIKIDFVTNGLLRISNDALAEKFELDQNYPNPFNGLTRINFTVSSGEYNRTRLIIFNELGQVIRTLYDNYLTKGHYSTVWDGKSDNNTEVASGMYFYMLKTGENIMLKRMTLLK